MNEPEREHLNAILSASLNRTVDFIKFAEAKNAALLTFSSAWIVASITMLFGSTELPGVFRIALTISLPLFGCAAVISIVSLLPKLRLSKLDSTPDRRINLLYFGEVARVNPRDFLGVLQARYSRASEANPGSYLDDLSIQVAVNSQIAVRKFRYFNCGAIIALLAMALLLGSASLHLSSLIWTN